MWAQREGRAREKEGASLSGLSGSGKTWVKVCHLSVCRGLWIQTSGLTHLPIKVSLGVHQGLGLRGPKRLPCGQSKCADGKVLWAYSSPSFVSCCHGQRKFSKCPLTSAVLLALASATSALCTQDFLISAPLTFGAG